MSLCETAVQAAQEPSRAKAVDSAPPSQTGHTTYETTNKLVWHYTHSRSFHGILKDGIIRPATAYVPAGSRPSRGFRRSSSGNRPCSRADTCLME